MKKKRKGKDQMNWKLPLFEVQSNLTTDHNSHVLAIFQNSSKKAISPSLPYRKDLYEFWIDRLRKEEIFQATEGSCQGIRTAQKTQIETVFFLGMGNAIDLNIEKCRVAGGHFWSKMRSEKCEKVMIHVDSFFPHNSSNEKRNLSQPIDWVKGFAEGFLLAAYEFKKYRTTKRESQPSYKVQFYTSNKNLRTSLEKEIKSVQAIAEAIQITRDWSNEPSNIGTPEYYALSAQKLAQQKGLKCKILTEADAKREKMGMYLGVAQGAEREGRIVVLEYNPPKSVKGFKTLAIVGKGVTFDSGGISIKPSLKMEEMKHDMTGAASVMGAMLILSHLKPNHRVIGVMVFTENMPDGNAIQPGNILTARNGKTVEVWNTDAEGRLILGDALDYVQDYNPEAIVDIATLTGAVSVALGKHCCAVLGNNDDFVESIKKAGHVNGEKIWQLPLFDEYLEDLKSDCADLKNVANDGNGGTIRAAIFLKEFIRPKVLWAHLDIAGTAYHMGHLSYYPKKGASGAYVRTLAQWIMDYGLLNQ